MFWTVYGDCFSTCNGSRGYGKINSNDEIRCDPEPAKSVTQSQRNCFGKLLRQCDHHLLQSLTVEWMCVCRGSGVNMITDVLYSVNMYIRFCVNRFELSHVMDIALWKCYVLLLLSS